MWILLKSWCLNFAGLWNADLNVLEEGET